MATDCGDGDYLGAYRRFFEDFVDQVDPDDQLPVKVSAYDLTEAEITGEIIDWTLEYLNQKYCPPSLQSYLVHLVMEEVKLLCSKQPEACGWRFQENTFAPLRLMQVVTGKVNEICQRYLDNSRLALLPPPPSTPIPLVSRCAIKNSRRKMEDRHVVIHDLHTIFSIQDDSVVNYYAVFDGHAGQDAAVYCAAHLHQYLAESSHYPTDPERALRDAFLTTDAHFIEKSNKQNLNSGTTAVCALLLNRKLYIAWVGDSQAVLAKRGQITQLVNPHKPDRDDERERVNEMGGAVMHWGIWRVNGQLAVSRAIGDVQYKPYVTGDPDVRCIPLDGTEDFLIVACDGLWDFVSEAMATTLVYQQLREDPRDLEAVSQRLVCYAKSHGSTDNISAIVVFLTNPCQIAARHPSAHPLLADVQLNNMEPTNPFLSNANNGLQFDINSFGKQQQQEQQQQQQQQSPRNGTCPDLKNEEDVWYEGFRNPPPSNGKISSIDEIGTNFQKEYEKSPKENNGDEEDDDDDDDEDDDLGPETDVDAVDLGFDLSNQQINENLSRELFPEKHEHGELIETKEEEETTSKDDKVVAPLQPKEPDQHALITEADNVADSEDSEDEWNYYPNKEKDRISTTAETGERKNEKAQITTSGVTSQSEEIIDQNKTRSPEPPGLGAGDSYIEKETELPELIESEICAKKKEIEEEKPEIIVGGEREEEMDFQLNPDAAEFVPVSPPKILTARANLNDDFPLSGSPQKQTPEMDDISLPSQREFQHEVCLRPHDMMEPSANGGNQPETTKDLAQTEFTDYLMDRQKSINIPAFGLDESEVSSTKAEFGDESTLSFVTATDFHKTGTAINEDSLNNSEIREDYDIATDPMAMSFTPGDFEAAFDKSCDLNVVHQLNESDLTGEEEDAALHPELSSLVTPEADNPPPTSAFPETRGDEENPESPEPLIKNDSILLSGMVELINPVDNDGKVFEEEQLEHDYHALDTSSPLNAEGENKEQEQPSFCSFLGPPQASSIADLDQDVETCFSSSSEIPKSSSPAPEDQILSPEVPASPLMAVSPSPCDEPETALVSEETAIPEAEPLEAFDSANKADKQLAEPLLQFGNETADKNFDAFKLEEELTSAIIESDISRDIIATPPPSQNESNNETQIANSSPDEQFKLVLDETEIADSPAEIEEFKSEPVETGKENIEPVIKAIDHVDVNKEVNEIEDSRVAEKPSEQLLDMEEKTKPENLPEPEIEVQKEEAVASLEATSPFHKEAPELAEFETLETLVDEQLSTVNAPVMNLSESMQEFTGLEQQLNPEPEAAVPLTNGIFAPEIEEKPVLESQSEVEAAAAVDLIGDEIMADHVDQKDEEKELEKAEEKKEEVSVDDKIEETVNVEEKTAVEPVLESKETENVVLKIEETREKTESKTEAAPVDVPLAAAAAAAAGIAAVAGVTAAAAKTTKAKPGVKAAPRSAATVKTSNRSTPTSPTKGASAASRTTTTTTSLAAKKPPTTATRPKQLETGKTASVGTTTKTTAPKSTVASKTTTTTSTLNKSSPASRSNATATMTTTTKPRIGSATAASKLAPISADKKPTTNGDAKAPSKPTAAPKTTTRNLTNTTTSVSSKPTTKTSTAPRPASASLSTTSNPKSRPLSSISTAKPKPAASGTSSSASPRPKTAPTSVGAKLKPTISSTRSPATDKQTKETTNKQLSSNRTSTSTLAKSGRVSMTGTGGATTLAKRSLSGKNVPAPATTAQPQKKPAPITRPGGKLSTKTAAAAAAAAAATAAGKTTTTTTTTSTITVTENLVQNGVSESHEIKTVVSNVEEDVPQKDVSPITTSTDNQLIMTAD